MTNRHKKRPSTSVIIREMQIKAIMRCHLIPVRMAIIIKSTNNSCRECKERGILLHCWWECKQVQPLWRTVWRFLMIQPYDPAIPLLGQDYSLKKEMANFSSILAWEIPWREEPDWLQSMGSQKSWTPLSN